MQLMKLDLSVSSWVKFEDKEKEKKISELLIADLEVDI